MIFLTRRDMILASTAGAAIALTPTTKAMAAPAAQRIDGPWDHFEASGAVDHSAWNDFLAAWVRPGIGGVNRVGYADITAAAADSLRRYLDIMQGIEPATLHSDQQMAFWVNLYNALTVDLMINHWPVDSIREIYGGFFNRGPWQRKIAMVAGHALSLNDIEHGILRPIWNDARIHYVVNCASVGCPNLPLRPFEIGMLDAAARDFINNPRGVRIDARNRLIISSIYDWYWDDFGPDNAALIAHLRAYAQPDLSAALAEHTTIDAYEYDWDTNVWL